MEAFGWGTPIGLGLFFTGLGIFFMGIAALNRADREKKKDE